jgi:hypothetical protein
MKIMSENKQRIHDALITDLQKRLFKQYNERTSEFIQLQMKIMINSKHC